MHLQIYAYTYVFYEASLPMSTRGFVYTSLFREDAPDQMPGPQLRLRGVQRQFAVSREKSPILHVFDVEAAGIEPAPTDPPVSPEPLEDEGPSDGPS